MAPEHDFLDLMPDTVTVYAQSSLDNYGKRTFSASGTSYSARIQYENRMQRDEQGREVNVIGTVYLYGTPALTTDHRITLPDGSTPIIVSVQQQRDESGAHHTVLTVGR